LNLGTSPTDPVGEKSVLRGGEKKNLGRETIAQSTKNSEINRKHEQNSKLSGLARQKQREAMRRGGKNLP